MRTLLLATLLALSACDGPAPVPADAGLDAPTPDAGPAGSLEDVFCAPLASWICERADACGCGQVLPGGALDRDACEGQYTTRCLEAWGPFVTAGAVLDADAAAACVASMRERLPSPCARPDGVVPFALCEPFLVDPSALGEACDTPWCAGGRGACDMGTRLCGERIAEGGTCDNMFACATGLVCEGGTCRALAGEGETCASDVACDPPLRCVASECTALGAVGAPCADVTACAFGLVCEGGECAERRTCEDGTCGRDAICAGARTCTSRLALGAACTESRQCAPELWCSGGACATRPADGEPCGDGTTCAAGLGCDGTGVCRALPGDGEPCAMGELGPFLCADALGCVDGTCAPLPTEGETCTQDNRCAGELGCDFSPAGSICIVRRGAGGSCESDRSCADGFHCGSGGTCEADLESGSPCEVGNECAGVCGPDAGGAFVCRDAPGDGDPCLFGDECPESLACLAAMPVCLPPICREI